MDALTALAERLGKCPQLLKLANRRLYEDVVQYDTSLLDAIVSANEDLDEFGLTTFDVNDPQERSQAIAASYNASLKWLKQTAQYGRSQVDEVIRFLELAIFPEDTAIPVGTLAIFWQQTDNLSAKAAERVCRRLAELSLVLRFDVRAQTILLHDITRHYLNDQISPEQYRLWQRKLLDGYRAQCDGAWWQLPDDGYVYQHLL